MQKTFQEIWFSPLPSGEGKSDALMRRADLIVKVWYIVGCGFCQGVVGYGFVKVWYIAWIWFCQGMVYSGICVLSSMVFCNRVQVRNPRKSGCQGES